MENNKPEEQAEKKKASSERFEKLQKDQENCGSAHPS
jgi:hypothetical protein